MTSALAAPAALAAGDFDQWLRELRSEARGKGVSDAVLDDAFKGVRPLPRVIELDRKQPEFTLTWAEYLGRVVNEARVEKGRALAAENARLLGDVAARFKVAPGMVVALWGIESDFGRLTGGFNVIAALATLAFDGRRASFFRGELMEALRILQGERMPAAAMLGSWAGAMGQCQFMPSSFRNFAVDFNGDGRRDIWTTLPDVLGSAANYLAKSGWKAGEAWGDPVLLTRGIDPAQASLNNKRPTAEWLADGIVPRDGSALRDPGDRQAALLLPDGIAGPAYLVYRNFSVILRWNRSNFFALAAGTLADRISRGL
ncbi:lytic transglycosylase domain-containing protein [Desertibaculum subflavum]|uniref:lytic transglycosylase domain-containing protein n=1 Tax=Desertibaculum subflavum TaxID=2268458 RepID=UPI0034D1DBDE